MKKISVFLFISALFINCKNDSKSPSTAGESPKDGITRELSGNFTYYADAAVFQTKNALFGVMENEKTQELIKISETLKEDPTDEVAVTLKVNVFKKPEHEEGWENRIEIIDIISVSKIEQSDSSLIKLKSEN